MYLFIEMSVPNGFCLAKDHAVTTMVSFPLRGVAKTMGSRSTSMGSLGASKIKIETDRNKYHQQVTNTGHKQRNKYTTGGLLAS